MIMFKLKRGILEEKLELEYITAFSELSFSLLLLEHDMSPETHTQKHFYRASSIL